LIPLDGKPSYARMADALVMRAAECLEGGDIPGAVECLESAIDIAPPESQVSIRETLTSLYVSRNQNAKLIALLSAAERLSPQLAIGALLVVRNRDAGIGDGLPEPLSLATVLDAVRQHIGSGQYSADELKAICSLLVQIRQAGMAVPLLLALIGMKVEVDEELVVAVLTLALDVRRNADCIEIIEAITRLGGRWLPRSARYRVLVGTVPLAAAAAIDDKVIRFLRRGLA